MAIMIKEIIESIRHEEVELVLVLVAVTRLQIPTTTKVITMAIIIEMVIKGITMIVNHRLHEEHELKLGQATLELGYKLEIVKALIMHLFLVLVLNQQRAKDLYV